MIAAVSLMGIGYLLLSQVESYWSFVLVYTVLISLPATRVRAPPREPA
jgi:hypothetical protein